MRKNYLLKLILDPLPLMDYFLPEGGGGILEALMGEGGIRYCLQYHTVNPDYASRIAARFNLSYTSPHRPIDPVETRDLLAQPCSERVRGYLRERGFPLDLLEKYRVSSWSPHPHPYRSWLQWSPFNPKALMMTNRLLEGVGFDANTLREDFMMVPSFDRMGELNNLVLRFTDPHLGSIGAKWLFSHGRQATFGLEHVDPNSPVYLVEGFFDYVACREVGMNAVGLGSAFISEDHWRFLEGLDVIFLLDSDDTGVKYSEQMLQEGHKVAWLHNNYKDPYEWWINEGRVEFS